MLFCFPQRAVNELARRKFVEHSVEHSGGGSHERFGSVFLLFGPCPDSCQMSLAGSATEKLSI
jgi:hypothetical protein